MARTAFAIYRTKKEEIQHNSFECAAWSEAILLDEGEHLVEGEDKHGQIQDAVWFAVPGTLVTDNFAKYFCEARRKWRSSIYAHQIAQALVENRETQFKLLEGFEARRIDFTYNGEKCHTFGIFKTN